MTKKKKALSINFPVARVVLSDVLPYEVPIVFSNRYFYKFLCDHQIKFDGEKVSWASGEDDHVLGKLIKMIFGVSPSTPIGNSTIKLNEKEDCAHSVPFIFFTTHKKDKLRQLALMHPKGQMLVMDFYEKYKDLMIYYTGRSDFSLRAPKRVAGCTYIDFRSQIERQDKSDTLVEMNGENYENLKSFFVYERFSNVFKFYESKEYLCSESEFKCLTKLDISGCFDGIYTHSLSWAIYGKNFAKKEQRLISKSSFSGEFDWVMQKINYNETNGILIGPEVSRIFAEIILQAVDVEVLCKLLSSNLVHGSDYRIYRYVDDYFVFHDSDDVLYKIKMALQESLKKYKLSLNSGKEEFFNRPMITPVSIAKKLISDLLDRVLTFEVTDVVVDGGLPTGAIHVVASQLISSFKTILKMSSIEYGDVLNYSLSIVDKKLGDLIEIYKKLDRNEVLNKSFSKSIIAVLEFVFFVYSASPKVNTTIKLCRICQRIILLYKNEAIGLNYGDLLYQLIYEKCRGVVDDNSDGGDSKIEVMYLLVLMRQLGYGYRLSQLKLSGIFGFKYSDGGFSLTSSINYFSIVTLFFYMESKSRYLLLRKALEKHVLEKFLVKKESLVGDSEMVHLALDLMVCPFVDDELKISILALYGLDESDFKKFKKYNKYWFTKWKNFDFSKELDAKVSREVY